jgi:hypothetical protein
MRRRALLAGFAAGIGGLAGCSEVIGNRTGSPNDAGEQPTASPTPSPTGTSDPGQNPDDWDLGAASLVDLETANRTYALAPLRYRSDDGASVRMRFSSTETADGPATVEAELRNENPFENTFRLEWTPPFGRLASDIPESLGLRQAEHTYRVGLVFAPTANHELVEEPPALERAADGHWRLAGDSFPQLPERVRLAADETVRGEYALVGRAEGAGRGRPPGMYEFSRAGERPVRVSVWPTDAPGPTTDSRFTGTTVPDLPGESETAWFHDADASTPSFVRPSVERTDLPARVEFTFVNHSRESTRCGHWNLHKLVDGEWFHLGPYIHMSDCRSVAPGDTNTWTMRASTGEMAPCEAQHYPFLGGGRYAAVAGYGHATARSAALVQFDAPAVSVVPTDDVTTERTDGQVTVTSDRWRTVPDDGDRSRVELVLERAASADRTLIPEQVMRRRRRGLRNTLAFVAPDIERVVLRTDDRTTAWTVGYDDGAAGFRYEGQAYRVTESSR